MDKTAERIGPKHEMGQGWTENYQVVFWKYIFNRSGSIYNSRVGTTRFLQGLGQAKTSSSKYGYTRGKK